MSRAQIAVVGGGIAGLVAAAMLARRGLAPRVFEAAPQFGGRAQTKVAGGFCFNQGPHALYIGGAFHGVLSELGLAAPGNRLRLGGALALWGEAAHPLPTRPAGEIAPPLSTADTACLVETFARIGESGCGERGAPLRAFTGALPPAVATVIEALVRLSSYCHAPGEIDARAALDQLRLSFGGVIYVDGGWRTLVAQLALAAVEAGAILAPEQRVAAIACQGRAWRIEPAAGEAEVFEAVVLAVPPPVAVELVEGSAVLAAAAGATRPLRTMGLDLALADAGPGAEFALGMDAPTYLSLHSAVAELAPPGGGLLHLGRYLAPGEAPDPKHLKDLERLADRLRPGWRGQLVQKQRLVGITVASDFPHWRSGGRRAGVVVADAPGLFLAGDWVGERGMLSDAAAASAQVAAHEAAAFLAGAPA